MMGLNQSSPSLPFVPAPPLSMSSTPLAAWLVFSNFDTGLLLSRFFSAALISEKLKRRYKLNLLLKFRKLSNYLLWFRFNMIWPRSFKPRLWNLASFGVTIVAVTSCHFLHARDIHASTFEINLLGLKAFLLCDE